MAKATAAATPKSLVKREPIAFISVGITLLSTVLYLAPSVGIKIPPNVQKALTLGLQLAGGIGGRILVRPV